MIRTPVADLQSTPRYLAISASAKAGQNVLLVAGSVSGAWLLGAIDPVDYADIAAAMEGAETDQLYGLVDESN